MRDARASASERERCASVSENREKIAKNYEKTRNREIANGTRLLAHRSRSLRSLRSRIAKNTGVQALKSRKTQVCSDEHLVKRSCAETDPRSEVQPGSHARKARLLLRCPGLPNLAHTALHHAELLACRPTLTAARLLLRLPGPGWF